MPLAANVFCQKCVTGAKRYAGSVADTDIDGTREGDDPAAPRCPVPIDYMGCEIISKEKPDGRARGVKEFR